MHVKTSGKTVDKTVKWLTAVFELKHAQHSWLSYN